VSRRYRRPRDHTGGPIYGSVISDDKLRVRTPAALSSLLDDDGTLSIALGVPPAALAATYLLAVTRRIEVPVQACGVADDVPWSPTNGGLVPSATELVVETTVADRRPDFQSDRREAWEHGVSSTPLSLSVERVIATDDPVIPFSPVERPLADDLQLAGLATAATLYRRVNDYWGSRQSSGSCYRRRPNSASVSSPRTSSTRASGATSPTSLPSSLFDTVVVADEDVAAGPRTRPGDISVKHIPLETGSSANRPHQRRNGYGIARTGRLALDQYVNAAWDPRWDSYIAPRVCSNSRSRSPSTMPLGRHGQTVTTRYSTTTGTVAEVRRRPSKSNHIYIYFLIVRKR